MIENLGGATAQLVSLALDASALKHNLLAYNIANNGGASFSPKQLDFDALLRRHGIDLEKDDAALMQQADRLKQKLANGEGVSETTEKLSLDTATALLAENAVHYQALLAGIGKMGAILKMAISEKGEAA